MSHSLAAVAVCIAFVGLALSAHTDPDPDRILSKHDFHEFDAYLKKFGKTCHHGTKKCQKQKRSFRTNTEYIKKWNAEHPDEGYKLGLTKFSDWSVDEFKALLMEARMLKKPHNATKWYPPAGSRRAQGTKDWRNEGVVSAVRDQLQCGSCWAFASVGTIESSSAIVNKRTTKDMRLYSDEYLWACGQDAETGGTCDGYYIDRALRWVKANGIAQLADAPKYDLSAPECPKVDHVDYPVVDLHDVTGSVQLIAEYVDHEAPVAAGFFVCESFQHFGPHAKEQVYTTDCQVESDDFLGGHAVELVGFGTTDDGTDYWIAKNSWNADWGDDGGYFKIKRDVSAIHKLSVFGVRAAIIEGPE